MTEGPSVAAVVVVGRPGSNRRPSAPKAAGGTVPNRLRPPHRDGTANAGAAVRDGRGRLSSGALRALFMHSEKNHAETRVRKWGAANSEATKPSRPDRGEERSS